VICAQATSALQPELRSHQQLQPNRQYGALPKSFPLANPNCRRLFLQHLALSAQPLVLSLAQDARNNSPLLVPGMRLFWPGFGFPSRLCCAYRPRKNISICLGREAGFRARWIRRCTVLPYAEGRMDIKCKKNIALLNSCAFNLILLAILCVIPLYLRTSEASKKSPIHAPKVC
jgi:hypothetical protein